MYFQLPFKIRKCKSKCIKTYKKIFDVPIGFSDHTDNNISAIVSVALEL